MNKRDFTTVRLAQGEMHIYDFGGVKLHAYQTGDPLADEVFLVEKAGKLVAIESPCFTGSVAALNEYGAIRAEVRADVLELAELARSGGEDGGMSLLELRQRLDVLSAEQAVVLDQILENMSSPELNAQLEAVTAEKQNVLDQIAACQQDEEQRAAQASRQREMEEWLDQQPMCFTEYDDTLTRRFVERITVVDAETIQVKIRDIDVVIEQKIC